MQYLKILIKLKKMIFLIIIAIFFEGGIKPAGLQLNISHEFGSVKTFNLNRWIMLGQLSTGFLPRDKLTPPPVIYRFFHTAPI